MTDASTLSDRLDEVLQAWLAQLQAQGLQMAPSTALTEELSGWLDAIARGETDELMRRVALHARELGADGKPASAAVMQILLLDDALREATVTSDPLRAIHRQMIRVVADAHALGATQRTERKHAARLERAPILRIPGRAIVGQLLGPITPDLIDAVCGRLFAAAAGAEEPLTILDVSGAPQETETLHRSLEGFAKGADFARFTLHVTGLQDPDKTRRILDQAGVAAGRIVLWERLDVALADLDDPAAS